MPNGNANGGNNKPEAKKKTPREATHYVVLIRNSDMYDPLLNENGTIQEFEGFRRQDVLGDLVTENLIPVLDDGKTPEVAIVPARSFVVTRATVETKRTVSFDD